MFIINQILTMPLYLGGLVPIIAGVGGSVVAIVATVVIVIIIILKTRKFSFWG